MAKTPIGLGQFSGRVGGVVYAVQAGRQVVRAYQPIVSNPKSTAQSIQRAKGNLVGRISKITPWQILEGLGDNKFNRRARFLRLLLQKATAGQAAGDPSTFNAKLLQKDFIFSEGALIPQFTVTGVTTTQYAVQVKLESVVISAATVYNQGALVVAVIKQSTGEYESVVYKFVAPSEMPVGSANVQIFHPSEGAYTADVYFAPFAAADGSVLPTVSRELTSTDTSLDALLAVGTAKSSVVWGTSIFARSASFTPQTASSVRK